MGWARLRGITGAAKVLVARDARRRQSRSSRRALREPRWRRRRRRPRAGPTDLAYCASAYRRACACSRRNNPGPVNGIQLCGRARHPWCRKRPRADQGPQWLPGCSSEPKTGHANRSTCCPTSWPTCGHSSTSCAAALKVVADTVMDRCLVVPAALKGLGNHQALRQQEGRYRTTRPTRPTGETQGSPASVIESHAEVGLAFDAGRATAVLVDDLAQPLSGSLRRHARARSSAGSRRTRLGD